MFHEAINSVFGVMILIHQFEYLERLTFFFLECQNRAPHFHIFAQWQAADELDVALDVRHPRSVGIEGDFPHDSPLSFSCHDLFERPLVDLIGAVAEEDEAHQLNIGVGLEVVDGRMQSYGGGFLHRVAVGAGADGGEGD